MELIKKIYSKFTGLWSTGENTGQKVARASVLILLSRILIKGLYFIKTVILARLLFPDDFGLFGLATLAMTFLNIFFQYGFQSALIHQKDNLKKYLNVAWSYNLLSNIVMAGVLFFIAAPLAGDFFHNQNVIPLVKALSIVILIAGFENFGVLIFQKEFQFNRKFFYDVLSVFFEIAAVLTAAYFFRNAWALLLGTIGRNFFSVLLSYHLSPFRPRLDFDLKAIKHLFNYGKWITLSGMVGFLASQGDNLTIGRMLDAHQLGLYQVAFALGMLPVAEVAGVFSDILFPLFAKVQNNFQLLKEYFIKIFRIVFAAIIPAAAGIYILADEIVKFVYSAKWIGVAPILRIIVVFSIFEAFKTIINPLFLGIGKPKITTLLLVVKLTVMFSLIFALVKNFGVIGVAWAVFAGSLSAQVVSFFIMRSTINLGVRGFLKILSLPVISSAIMVGGIIALKQAIVINNKFIFLAFIFFGLTIYFVSILLLDRVFGKHYLNSLKWIKTSI
jgi:O-antigen/teichoic acid export membrane protein